MNAQTQTGTGQSQAPVIPDGARVLVNIFDGHIAGESGHVLAHALNSKNECVYLVEMTEQQPPMEDKLIGTEQIRQGKQWVLSLYPEEVRVA